MWIVNVNFLLQLSFLFRRDACEAAVLVAFMKKKTRYQPQREYPLVVKERVTSICRTSYHLILEES